MPDEHIDVGPLLTAALTSVRDLMPLHVPFALHEGPVLTEDTVVWSVPLGTVAFEDGKRIEFYPAER